MILNKKKIENIVQTPSKVLENTVNTTTKISKGVSNTKIVKTSKKYMDSLGPGLITGASDDDPSGIATYSQAGAQFGTKLIWLSIFTFPLMAVTQEMCARIALVTGRGLASNIKRIFPKKFYTFVRCFFS